ncbi:MAG: hypothetical protein V3U68_03850 [Bacteroidota bacterium]
MARAFTQREYASLEARKKHVTMMSGILAFFVPIETLFIFFVFAFLLKLGTATGLIVAVVLSSVTVFPLVILHRLKFKIDQDLQGQIAGECEGIVDKVWYGNQIQFAGVLINGERFQIPHELVLNVQKNKHVRVTYAQNSRIVLSVSPP